MYSAPECHASRREGLLPSGRIFRAEMPIRLAGQDGCGRWGEGHDPFNPSTPDSTPHQNLAKAHFQNEKPGPQLERLCPVSAGPVSLPPWQILGLLRKKKSNNKKKPVIILKRKTRKPRPPARAELPETVQGLCPSGRDRSCPLCAWDKVSTRHLLKGSPGRW